MEMEQLNSGCRIFVYDTCGSTMDLMLDLWQEGAAGPFDSVLAEIQTEGRGRMRKEWIASCGNLNVSFALPDDIMEKNGWPENLIPLLIGCGISEALAGEGIETGIKWPNDIVFREKKLGGILVEKKRDVYIVGVGLNIKERPDFQGKDHGFSLLPVSLADAGVSLTDPLALWRNMAEILFDFFEKTLAKETPMVFNRKFIRKCIWINETVELSTSSGDVATALLKGVSPSGALILKQNNEEFEVFSGSIRKPGNGSGNFF
ncbi:MAG: biotin--[acetyl-CoA-carboxylase] ligase [Desulfobacteraceae bacterium]